MTNQQGLDKGLIGGIFILLIMSTTVAGIKQVDSNGVPVLATVEIHVKSYLGFKPTTIESVVVRTNAENAETMRKQFPDATIITDEEQI